MNKPEKLPSGVVDIRGKQYQTVAYRVQLFRSDFPEHSLTTEIVERDGDCVVMRATIADPNGRVIANGHSEEYRNSSQINRTSALENAETSAIGRALAAFGIGGTEFASANEVENAIHQQAADKGAARGQSQEEGTVSPAAPISDADWAMLVQLVEATGTDTAKICSAYGVASLKDFTPDQFKDAKGVLEKRLKAKAKEAA